MAGQNTSERRIALLGMATELRTTTTNGSARSGITNSMHWLIRELDPCFIAG